MIDAILVLAGLIAGIGGFLTGKDSLYKLYLGLIIGFLLYMVIESQYAILEYIPEIEYSRHQVFLGDNGAKLLSLSIFFTPILGALFMLNTRLSFRTKHRSPSQIFLGILLPFFLLGILAQVSRSYALASTSAWSGVFDFFSKSRIYSFLLDWPSLIFLALIFVVIYKPLYLIGTTFAIWLYENVIQQFFKSWKENYTKQGEHNTDMTPLDDDEEDVG